VDGVAAQQVVEDVGEGVGAVVDYIGESHHLAQTFSGMHRAAISAMIAVS
jgi:hypothetical protein